MNRAQRRYGNNNSASLTSYSKEVNKKATEKATLNSLQLLGYTIALELHDKFEWDADKINKLFEKANNQMECILSGEAKLEDIAEAVKALGVIIE